MNGFWGPPCNFVWSFPCSKEARKVLAWFFFLLPSFGSSTWWEGVHQVCFPFAIMFYSSRPKCCDSICSTSVFLLFTPFPQEKLPSSYLHYAGPLRSWKPEVTHKQGDIAFMLYSFAVRFLLSSTIMKIQRLLVIWCRILLWQQSSRASCLRLTYGIVQN